MTMEVVPRLILAMTKRRSISVLDTIFENEVHLEDVKDQVVSSQICTDYYSRRK